MTAANRCQCKCECERKASKCPDELCGECCTRYERYAPVDPDHGPAKENE